METQLKQKSDLTLGEMLPDELSIKLKVDGMVREFELREINLMDFKWVQAIAGAGKSIEASMQDMGVVSKFLFRLIKDKTPLAPTKRNDYDDDGNPTQVTLTGPDRVLEGMTAKLIKENMAVLHRMFEDAMPKVEQTNKPVVQDFKKKQ